MNSAIDMDADCRIFRLLDRYWGTVLGWFWWFATGLISQMITAPILYGILAPRYGLV